MAAKSYSDILAILSIFITADRDSGGTPPLCMAVNVVQHLINTKIGHLMNKILILLFFLPTLVFGQLKEFLEKKEPDLQPWIKKIENSQEIQEIKAEGHFDDYRLDDVHSNNFYLVDFDADGLIDILFYGYTGGESKDIIFFRNLGERYEKVIGVMGKLVYVNSYKPFEPMDFAINQYGCCASKNDVFEYYTPTRIGAKFEYKLSNKIALTKGLKFPSSFIDSKSFGTAIATETDSSGRVWYFAIMINNIKPIKEILFKGYNNDKPYHSMGWISSRFIKEH